MSNVYVDKNKIDLLANAISAKSGESLTLTLDEMVEAVDGIESGGGITPTGNIDITQVGVTDVTEYATATISQSYYELITDHYFETVDGERKFKVRAELVDRYNGGFIFLSPYEAKLGAQTIFDAIGTGTSITPTESSQTIGRVNTRTVLEGAVTVNAIPSNYVGSEIRRLGNNNIHQSGGTVYTDAGYYEQVSGIALSAGTEGTPTATKGTVSNHAVTVTPSVTNSAGYITGGTHNGTAVSVSASELVSGTYIPNSYGNFDVTNYATVQVDGGSAGTPVATKGTVSNHSISVTPSVTNITGWITGSTKTGTAVTVSASELVSGSETKTANGTYDVTNLAELVVNVSGGGSSTMIIGTKTTTLGSASSAISFTGLSGNPLSFVVTSSTDQSTGGTTAVAVAYDGTSLHGMDVTTQAENDTGFTKSYSGGTLTITATTATFEANEYKLVYAYGGSSSDIHTANVQVGSGATSITFSGLSGRPLYFSCVFKSSFSTSSGYQRVIEVVNDGTNTYGHAFDSSAKAQTSWSYTYSGGSLTISSTGTNNGGYFHQPGYYQLTYAVDPNALTFQNKTGVTASTSSQTIYADNGYDALESVQINPVSQTNLVAGNIKSGTTVSISNGSTNLWSVTGTYTGGGGGDKNVQVLQSTTRVNASSLTKACGDLTVSKTGTYDVYWSGGRSNTSTSYTWGTRLYVDGSGYGTENTTWTNNCQSNHLSNVSLTANQKLSVYARGRSGSYYTFVPMLTIIEA